MYFVDLGGLAIHYSADGEIDGVPLVFIHSLGSDLRIWDAVIPHFAADFKIIRYDLRGHGLSDCPSISCTIQDHVDDLAGLLSAVKIESAILVGISVGGQVGMGYAAAFPERVRALVLCDTGAIIGSAQSWTERIDAVRENGIDHLGQSLIARWFVPTFASNHPAEYRGYYNMLTRTSVAGYLATCEAIRGADMRDTARKVLAKTLVLCGSEDVSTPPDTGRALAALLPDARFSLIPGAAHLPCVDQSAQFAAVIRQFLQESGYVG